jgi:hypothetical protein
MTDDPITPVFVCSLPRTGSTLLQRILAAHPQVATTSEPWLLLHQLYALRDTGVYAEYDHDLLRQGVQDFAATLPNGLADYRDAIRTFALGLYAKSAGAGARYFVDKTPRYSLVVDEVMEVFPDAKFVFLWRNPIAVVASIMQTWAGGRWNLYRFEHELHEGLANIVAAAQREAPAVHCLRYEDLVTRPAEEASRLFAFLDLPDDGSAVERFSEVQLSGRHGDHAGTGRYAAISGDSLDGWADVMSGRMRKRWCSRYLDWIGDDRLAFMGYDPEQLRASLDAVPTSRAHLGSDVVRGMYGRVRSWRERLLLGRGVRGGSE